MFCIRVLLALTFLGSGLLADDNYLVNLDPLLAVPSNWEMTVANFEKAYTVEAGQQFVWLTNDKKRAKFARNLAGIDGFVLTAFPDHVPVVETIVDFAGGRVNLVTVSIFNRGDEEQISLAAFKERLKGTFEAMNGVFQVRPRTQKADPTDGLLTEGFSWYQRKKGFGLLEYNENALSGNAREFLRLRLARPGAKGNLARALTHSRGGAAVGLDSLAENVKERENGDVFIDGIPMVDQGAKGYCVVAAAQRVFEYLGVGVDMHQLAQISDADPELGTDIIETALKVGKIDYRFKTRMDVLCLGPPGQMAEVHFKNDNLRRKGDFDRRKFEKRIRSNIEDGLPVMWALLLGYYPEDPPLHEQMRGGHLRLIIGFNEDKDEILFSDTWGAGHELKRMNMDDAYMVTTGLFTLKPTTR